LRIPMLTPTAAVWLDLISRTGERIRIRLFLF
jgi:hypothetical protein